MPALLYGDQEIHLGIETHLRNNGRSTILISEKQSAALLLRRKKALRFLISSAFFLKSGALFYSITETNRFAIVFGESIDISGESYMQI